VNGPVGALIERLKSPELVRFIRFGLVGGSGVVVNEGVAILGYYVLFASLGTTARDHVSVLAGIVVSIFTNFVLNDIWTWADRPKRGLRHWFQRLGLYYLFASVALVAQWIVTFSLSDWLLSWHVLVANLFGIGAAVLINWFFHNRWTFRPSPEE
jgi:dolichol-phosphate mannosyltransferase